MAEVAIDAKSIEQIRNARLLSSCGLPVQPSVRAILPGASWHSAVRALLDGSWEHMKDEAVGAITVHLTKRHPAAYQGVWNRLVRQATGQTEPIVESALSLVPAEFREPVRDSVRSDLLMCVMESSYAKFGVSVFYRRLLTAYLDGHLPCGWDADANGGTLIVF